MRILRGLGLLIAVLASGGCSGSSARAGGADGAQLDDAGVVALTTSVDGAIPLNQLTSAQATQLCADTTAFVVNAAVCQYRGLYDGLVNATISEIGTTPTDSQLQMACRNGDTATNCAESACNPTGLASNSPSCQSTVADLVACFSDTAVALKQQLGGLPTCDTLTGAQLATFNAATTDAGLSYYVTPASCTALQANCGGYILIDSHSF